MYGAFLKGTRTGMAVQALAIVVRLVKLDVFRRWRFSEVIHVDMSQPSKLGLDSAEHRIIRVARVAGFARRHAMILKVRRGQVLWIVHAQALSVRLHDVTRKAKPRALGVF